MVNNIHTPHLSVRSGLGMLLSNYLITISLPAPETRPSVRPYACLSVCVSFPPTLKDFTFMCMVHLVPAEVRWGCRSPETGITDGCEPQL